MKQWKYQTALMNFLTPVYVVGGPIHAISSTPFCPGSMPLAEISWPRYLIPYLKKWHLDSLSFNPWWAKWSKTACSCVRWSSGISEYMMTSSRYTIVNERFSSLRQFCLRCWNIARVLQRLYGMHTNLYTPILLTVNAVYWQESSETFTCQKPLLRSMVEKYFAPTRDCIISSHLGIGYESFFVWVFRCLKSMQDLRVPSFFHTSMTALHHGDWVGHMAPPSSISWMCCHTSSTS